MCICIPKDGLIDIFKLIPVSKTKCAQISSGRKDSVIGSRGILSVGEKGIIALIVFFIKILKRNTAAR